MSDGKRILIVDDSELLCETLSDHLSRTEHYSCVCETKPDSGLKMAQNSYFDMIILDVQSETLNTFEICRQLRDADIVAPIIVLTADISDGAMIEGLDAGATDCVTKPFKLGVLMARIRAHIRQFEHSEEAQLNIGPFFFNASTKTLSLQDNEDERPIHLTDKEAQIVKFLYLHSDRLISREELLGEVWGYNAGITTHTLETHVYRLRQKMEIDPSDAKILVTEPGGYRLIPEETSQVS